MQKKIPLSFFCVRHSFCLSLDTFMNLYNVRYCLNIGRFLYYISQNGYPIYSLFISFWCLGWVFNIPPIFHQCNLEPEECEAIGVLYINLLEFPFVYNFYSRMTTLDESIFWNSIKQFVFFLFHNPFKLFWYGLSLKIRGIFCFYLFWGMGIWQLNW